MSQAKSGGTGMHLVTKTPKIVAPAFFAALAASAALAGSAGAEHGTPSTTQLISRPSGTGAVSPGAANSSTVGRTHNVSADGRFVVFESKADGLSNDDDDTVQNVYARDLQTGVTTLVSRATGPNGASAHKESADSVISADGTHVAFATSASLDPADTNAIGDIYVRDLTNNTTTLVSRATGAAGVVGNNYSGWPSLDADGKRVAFSTNATNVDPADANTFSDVYVRDLASNTTTLVSRAAGAAGVRRDSNSSQPSISNSGSRIAFFSCASNLDPSDTNANCDVFMRDLGTNPASTWLERKTSGGLGSPLGAASPSISGDGKTIAFDSQGKLDPADTNNWTDVYIHELTFGKTYLVSRADGLGAVGNANSQYPSINADGTKIAFASVASNFSAADTNKTNDIYVRDLTGTETTKLVSRDDTATGAVGSNYSNIASISGDGTKVVFSSYASNFAASPGPDFTQVYMRNLSANSTTLVSRSSGTGPYPTDVNHSGFSEAYQNKISADGRLVVFGSLADSLSTGDDNNYRNVFVRDALSDATTLVSVAPTGPANGYSGDESISSDGTTVAFDSNASNLVAGDNNGTYDVFV